MADISGTVSSSQKSPPAVEVSGHPQVAQPPQQFFGRQEYHGVIPPPLILQQFDELIPGTAQRLIQWAEDEQRHRQSLEREAQAANIDAQRRQLAVAERQARAIFFSDALGQCLGFVVCLGCVAGSIWTALAGHTAVAIALAALPTAAVIQAFRAGMLGSRRAEPQRASS